MGDLHPAARAEIEAQAKVRVLAWAAEEGVAVADEAVDRLVARLAGHTPPAPAARCTVVPFRRRHG